MASGGNDDAGETREMTLDELMLGESGESPGVGEEEDFALADDGPRQPVIGEYVLLRRIGAGGNGRVFKARHRQMERLVALKMMSPATMKDPDAVRRFRREMKAAAKLFHPNIVTAFDAGESQGVHYLVMEYVEGLALTQVVDQHGTLTVEKAIDFVIQAARGLHYAHSREVVHRDIKPNNLILDNQGHVKVLDLGTARFEDDVAPSDLTQTGVIMGTVNYMSPEQARSASSVDQRSDVYSLGCTLYFLLTGMPVFDGNVMEVLMAHAEQAPPSVRGQRADVPEWLDRVIQKMLAKSPEHRHQSMQEVIADLEDRGASMGQTGFAASSLKHQVRRAPSRAVGIDIGAYGASIAYVDESGAARPLKVQGETRLLAAVAVGQMSLAVGQDAVERGALGADVARRIKRQIGRPVFDQRLDNAAYPPEVLVSLLISQLAREAHDQIGDFHEVVLAVPSAFGDLQRKSMEDAGFLAGLEVVDLINEPSAAMLFAAQSPETIGKTMLVLDLGAGKLDVAVGRREDRRLHTLGLAGDLAVGGLDWDDRLADLVADQLVAHDAPDPRLQPATSRELTRLCEQAKIQLSTQGATVLALQPGSQRVLLRIERQRFAQLTSDLTLRVGKVMQDAMAMSQQEWGQLDRVFANGQAARMPEVLGQLPPSIRSRCEPLPATAVACGAALHAAARLRRRQGVDPSLSLEDVASHSVGIVGIDSRTGRRLNAVLIPRGAGLPTATRRTFKTHRDNQAAVLVQIVQGDEKDADNCLPVGKCVISNLPEGLPAGTRVEVEFQCAANGRLTVFVESPTTGFRATQEITRAQGLSLQQRTRWREWVETIVLCSNLS